MQTCNPGDILNNRYRLERVLGAGGMGQVWLGFDTMLERYVAIKEVWPPRNNDADTKQLYARIEREARNAARAGDLPGIVTVHDVVTDGSGRPFIVMEYIDCPTLHKYVEEHGPFTANAFVGAALGLVRSLVAVHKKGIMHRDIKPGNVLVQEDGALVLLDFGIARYSDDTLTANGNVIGTPAFMSPQQLGGGRATEAMDVWLLGMTFYYALTGTVPFRREDTTATMLAVLHDELPPLPAGHPMYDAVMGMLRKDAAKRFTLPYVIEMLSAVAQPVPVRPSRKPKKPRNALRRRVVLVSAVCTVIVFPGSWWVYEEFGGGRTNDTVTPTLTSSPTPRPSASTSAAPTVFRAKSFQMAIPPGMTVTGGAENVALVYVGQPSTTYIMEWLGRGKLQDLATKARGDDVPGANTPAIDYADGVAFWQYDNMTVCGSTPLAAKWCQRGHHMGVVAPAGRGHVVVRHSEITKYGPLTRDYPSKDTLIATAKQLAGAVQ